jgi:hypothetical protein
MIFATPIFAANLSIDEPASKAHFEIDPAHGNLAAASLAGSSALSRCYDEYWFQGDDGKISDRSDERDDRVLTTHRQGQSIILTCRNDKLGLDLIKAYAPSPTPGGLRKTVTVKPFARHAILHLMSRARVADAFAPDAYLYTPRQSWGGATLLFGVRPLADVKQETKSTSGWDNRFVVAFHRDRSLAISHWRSEVDGVWVPHSGIAGAWGQEPFAALTYLPDGWRFRLLFCAENTTASASADYVLHRGDWYDAWALYKDAPGFKSTYRGLADIPAWCRQIKYGTFWNGPEYESFAASTAKLADRLGPDAYVSVGVFGWSLDGDYETARPFLQETLGLAMTPAYMRRCVSAIQQHPRVKTGLYIQGGLIDEDSQCFRDHPDWVIHGRDGKPFDSGFADNPTSHMYLGDARVRGWVDHFHSRIAAVCKAYDCGWIYLDGGGYSEDLDGTRRTVTGFPEWLKLNEGVLKAVRSTGADRGLLVNCQNAPFGDMSWLECGYFAPEVPWRETVDFCFDTEALQDPRYTLEPLYWSDNDRYLAMCIAFGFTPCGDVSVEKPEATWRAIDAAYRMKLGRLILNSAATSPVWWRDAGSVVTFAERVGDDVVVPVLNFGASSQGELPDQIEVTVDLAAVGIRSAKPIRAETYRPLLSATIETVQPRSTDHGKLTFDLTVPKSWSGLTLLTLR